MSGSLEKKIAIQEEQGFDKSSDSSQRSEQTGQTKLSVSTEPLVEQSGYPESSSEKSEQSKDFGAGSISSKESRQRDILLDTSNKIGTQLNPLLIIKQEGTWSKLPDLLGSMSDLVAARNTAMNSISKEEELDHIKDQLFYFEGSFGKQGFFKLESHFTEECSAKILLKQRRKPAYAIFYYDDITGYVYSELDQKTFKYELEDIKQLLTSITESKEKTQILQLIAILLKNSQQTKEYRFWEQYFAERELPTEIQQKTLINSEDFFKEILITNNFFKAALNATKESGSSSITETIRSHNSLFIFQDDHSLEAIPNVLLKLISSAICIEAFTNQQNILCVEYLNNNYQILLDTIFEELQKNKEQSHVEAAQKKIYNILKTTINHNNTIEDPILLVKARLIITCMLNNIKPIAIDISTDTKRQLDKTHPYPDHDIESDFVDQEKETRIHIGDQGMVHFIRAAIERNKICIVLVGADHAKGIKENLCTEMKTINVSIQLDDRNQNDWEVSANTNAEIEDKSVDLNILVSRQYRFSESPIELHQPVESITENIIWEEDDESESIDFLTSNKQKNSLSNTPRFVIT